MNSPAACCEKTILLSEAIQMMLLCDMQRLFVQESSQGPVSGVLSLSDATRFRSGTCKACATGLIMDTAIS